jgi:hypothetical protein
MERYVKEISWGEPARIYRRVHFEQGPPRERAIHMGDLNTLVQVAVSGLDGPLEELFIRTDSGAQFEANEISLLAVRSDRPQLKQHR